LLSLSGNKKEGGEKKNRGETVYIPHPSRGRITAYQKKKKEKGEGKEESLFFRIERPSAPFVFGLGEGGGERKTNKGRRTKLQTSQCIQGKKGKRGKREGYWGCFVCDLFKTGGKREKKKKKIEGFSSRACKRGGLNSSHAPLKEKVKRGRKKKKEEGGKKKENLSPIFRESQCEKEGGEKGKGKGKKKAVTLIPGGGEGGGEKRVYRDAWFLKMDTRWGKKKKGGKRVNNQFGSPYWLGGGKRKGPAEALQVVSGEKSWLY